VPAGTEATVIAIAASRLHKAGEEHRFVQVRPKDGVTGWVPLHAVSVRRK
jgi:hypothetical protein